MAESSRRRRIGRATRWTDAQLDALVTVTPDDIAAASGLWKRAAPPELRDLLDALPVEADESTAG